MPLIDVTLHNSFDAEHFPAGLAAIAAMFGAAVETLHGVIDNHVEERAGFNFLKIR